MGFWERLGNALGEKVEGVFSQVQRAGFLPTWVAWQGRGTARSRLWVRKISWKELCVYFGGLGASPTSSFGRSLSQFHSAVPWSQHSPVLSRVVPKQVLCSRILTRGGVRPSAELFSPCLPHICPHHPFPAPRPVPLSPLQRSRGGRRGLQALSSEPSAALGARSLLHAFIFPWVPSPRWGSGSWLGGGFGRDE